MNDNLHKWINRVLVLIALGCFAYTLWVVHTLPID